VGEEVAGHQIEKLLGWGLNKAGLGSIAKFLGFTHEDNGLQDVRKDIDSLRREIGFVQATVTRILETINNKDVNDSREFLRHIYNAINDRCGVISQALSGSPSADLERTTSNAANANTNLSKDYAGAFRRELDQIHTKVGDTRDGPTLSERMATATMSDFVGQAALDRITRTQYEAELYRLLSRRVRLTRPRAPGRTWHGSSRDLPFVLDGAYRLKRR